LSQPTSSMLDLKYFKEGIEENESVEDLFIKINPNPAVSESLMERLQNPPLFNKKYNFLIMESNFAIKENLKNVFFLEFDLLGNLYYLNKEEKDEVSFYSILNNDFVKKEAKFKLRVSKKSLNPFSFSLFLFLSIISRLPFTIKKSSRKK